MRVIIRADASFQIGTGHVMRCLTLAELLISKGADCSFICREHEGHLIEFIQSKGMSVHVLPVDEFFKPKQDGLFHACWLGASQEEDAELCYAYIESQKPDWLIVDHYALDLVWERKLKTVVNRLLVIDDLVDRYHISDVLLDQTYGRNAEEYHNLVPSTCKILAGSDYSLLRPEFYEWRDYSLNRRKQKTKIKKILINLGGVDKDNITQRVLESLTNCALPIETTEITVVMGSTAPWVEAVQEAAKILPWKIKVLTGVKNMAELMANSDLAIGAAGATSWERCCLGLPTIMLVLAPNQYHVAVSLESAGAAVFLAEQSVKDKLAVIIDDMIREQIDLTIMSSKAAEVTNGSGCTLVAEAMSCF